MILVNIGIHLLREKYFLLTVFIPTRTYESLYLSRIIFFEKFPFERHSIMQEWEQFY